MNVMGDNDYPSYRIGNDRPAESNLSLKFHNNIRGYCLQIDIGISI